MVFHFDASAGAFVAELTAASYGFNGPCSVAADGTHVWVGNCHGDSVTELDAATGAPVQVLDTPRYKIYLPVAIASDGTHVWVANNSGDSVTEFPASL
jgi:DNA-binding beta-propeller fold protein YncE